MPVRQECLNCKMPLSHNAVRCPRCNALNTSTCSGTCSKCAKGVAKKE